MDRRSNRRQRLHEMTKSLCRSLPRGGALLAALVLSACAAKDATGPVDSPPPPPPPPSPTAARLAFTVQPADGKIGNALSPAIQIELRDANGNVVSTATNQVTVSLGNNPGGATLSGTTEVAAVDGVATFHDLALDQPGDGYTLTASAPDLQGATSQPFALTAALLSIEERKVVFDAVQQLMADLPGDDIDADKQIVLDFLAARPELSDVGLSEKGTIWATFTDGVPYFIMDNHTLASSGGLGTGTPPRTSMHRQVTVADPPVVLSRDSRAAVAAPLRAGPSGLPRPGRFRLLNGFGDFFDSTDPSAAIKKMLEDKGYADAGGDRVATVQVLRTIGANTGILYFRSHGGNAILNDIANTEVDGLWTATPVSVPEPDDIFDDMLARRLGYATELNSRKLGILWPEEATHYMITAEFIRHYWSNFGDNSFVYFDGCWGATMQTVENALQSKNVSVFASWTHVSQVGANERTAKFVFDRLLGANQFEPEDPEQRPFDYEAVASKFRPNGPGHQDFISPATGNRIIAILDFAKLGGEFGLMAPSIQTLTVDEFTNELTIDGIFGKDPGAGKRVVTIGDVPLTVKSWSEHEIVVSDLDATAAGYVVVKALEHPSNAVPLTRWEGRFVYSVDLGQVWAPGLKQDVTCDIHFRADVHGFRVEPGQAPTEPLVQFVPTESSTCEFTMSGSGTDDTGFTISASGGGPMERAGEKTVPPDYFTASGLIDVATKRITMSLTLGAWGEVTLDPPDGEPATVPEPLVTDLWTLWGAVKCPPAIPPAGFELPSVAQGFGIQGDSRSGTGGCEITDIPNTLEWLSITPTSEPKSQDRR